MVQHEEGYEALRNVLDRAYDQAARGKGKERHASGEPFHEQLIVKLGVYMGDDTRFNIGQACKKSIESIRLPRDRAVAELLGAINYLAGAVVILEGSVEECVKVATAALDALRCKKIAGCDYLSGHDGPCKKTSSDDPAPKLGGESGAEKCFHPECPLLLNHHGMHLVNGPPSPTPARPKIGEVVRSPDQQGEVGGPITLGSAEKNIATS